MTEPTPDLPPPSEPVPSNWMVIVGTAAGVFLGVIFIVGLYGKALDPEGFVETIQGEGLDFLLPASWVAAIALFLEAILGFALVMGLRRMRILVPSAGLSLFFVFLTARAYILHDPGAALDDHSCGCFGNLVERSPAEAFWQDLLMLVPSSALAFLARPPHHVPHVRTRYIVAGSLTAVVLVFALLAPGLPIDDLATRLSPGSKVAELCAGEDKPGEPAKGEAGEEEMGDGSIPPPEGRVCLLDLIPELGEGESVVVMADLADPGLKERLEAFSNYAIDAVDAPLLFVITDASEEELEAWRTENQPAFDLLQGYRAVLRPLYRRLPRSFLVKDGTVTRTIQGWPPLADLAAAAEQPGSGNGGSEDDDAPDDQDGKDG
ncbi:MAG: hypothetical protein QNJ90_10715 [Planctomycetota bacterium]|nr:hypothetical protein [Planctomycetota bacterium]